MDLQQYLINHNLSMTDLEEAIKIKKYETAIITGSLVDEVGDKYSDLDIYIFTDRNGLSERSSKFADERKEQQIREEFGIQYLKIADLELDVEYHLFEKYFSAFSIIDELEDISDVGLLKTFSGSRQFDFKQINEIFHRFRIGIPLCNLEIFHEMKISFPEEKYIKWSFGKYLVDAEDYLKGFKRNIAEGDAENAFFLLSAAYDALGDAIIFKRKHSIDRWKWRVPKLRKLQEDNFLKDYMECRIAKNLQSSDGINLNYHNQKCFLNAEKWLKELKVPE